MNSFTQPQKIEDKGKFANKALKALNTKLNENTPEEIDIEINKLGLKDAAQIEDDFNKAREGLDGVIEILLKTNLKNELKMWKNAQKAISKSRIGTFL